MGLLWKKKTKLKQKLQEAAIMFDQKVDFSWQLL